MQRASGDVRGNRRRLFLTLTGSVGFAIAYTCSLTAAIPCPVQQQTRNTTTVAPAYEFEATSIKPNKSDIFSFSPGFTVDGFRASNANVLYLIRQAYGVAEYELSGGPEWLSTQRYDVEAKMDQSVADALSKLTPAQLKLARQQLLQTLLAERFNLKVHRETKDEPVYFLVIGKNGPKLQYAKTGKTSALLNADGTPTRDSENMQIIPGSEGGQKIQAFSTRMKSLGDWLTRQLSRPVLDKTGLTGAYDFTLEWIPDTGPEPAHDAANADGSAGTPGASTFTALEQQLGLKLEPGKSSIEITVIDHVEKPAAN